MAVTPQAETDLWDYQCEAPFGCGDELGSFRSYGWATQDLAEARGAQHDQEHETGEPMQALHEFEAGNN